jgi:anti-sigma factor RsiW
MNDTLFEELLALRHKRPLTPDEQARLDGWLAAHPADRDRWAEEGALSRALHRLPQSNIPSNFMARVWQDIEAAEREEERTRPSWPNWFRRPSLAQQFALAVLVLAAVLVFQGRRARTPTQVARSIEQVATLARVPSVELLKDFEAIRRLNQPSADLELLAAFESPR